MYKTKLEKKKRLLKVNGNAKTKCKCNKVHGLTAYTSKHTHTHIYVYTFKEMTRRVKFCGDKVKFYSLQFIFMTDDEMIYHVILKIFLFL